jgi:hypothetical protein
LSVEEIKNQINIAKRAVEDLSEPLKSTAFGVVLSKLLEELFATSKIKATLGEPLFVGRPSEEPPMISGATSCREAIAKLFASDWGRTPRTLREIIDAMKLNAIYYSDTNVAVELNRMTRLGILRRIKDKKGYKYVSAKPTST